MKRAVVLYSLIFIWLATNGVVFGQSNPKSDTKKVCPFNIVGMWKSDTTTDVTSIFFNFSPEGWVSLQGHSANTLPEEFEIITVVNYKLDKPSAPQRIELTASRGNDAFKAGTTSLEVTAYSDNVFITANLETGQQTRWERVQTHRYFLTLAARSGAPEHALAMWTSLDGRPPKVEVLGVQLTKDAAGKTLPVFGPIPAEIYDRLREPNEEDKKTKKDDTVIVRFELTRAEYERTHTVYEAWDKQAKAQTLPNSDPYLNGIEFMAAALGGLNQCGEKAKLYRLGRGERDELASKHVGLQLPLEYVRVLKKKNEELHVNDLVFPWQWRPVIELPGQ